MQPYSCWVILQHIITDAVLVKAIWTLKVKGKRYNLDKDVIIKVLHSLFEEPNVVFDSARAGG